MALSKEISTQEALEALAQWHRSQLSNNETTPEAKAYRTLGELTQIARLDGAASWLCPSPSRIVVVIWHQGKRSIRLFYDTTEGRGYAIRLRLQKKRETI